MSFSDEDISILRAMEIDDDQITMSSIFMKHSMEKLLSSYKKKIKFVHYTRAENIKKIFETKSFWMRKTSCMNDFMEISHGMECLKNTWHGETGNNFKSALDKLFPELSKKVAKRFDDWADLIKGDTYVACFSEHYPDEDRQEYDLGRLSMWRAYGQGAAVAIIFRGDAFFKPLPELNVVASPVAYVNDSKFDQHFADVTLTIKNNSDYLKSRSAEDIENQIFHMLRYSVIGAKHPGFEEEKEWRLTYTPRLDGETVMTCDVETIGGVPQPVWKIPLRDIPEKKISGIAIRDLIDRIIIGPTQYPMAVWDAVVKLVKDAGIDKAESLVKTSGIPLRT